MENAVFDKTQRCKGELLGGKKCGAPTIAHPRYDTHKLRLCNNPICPRYYICSCGKEVGRHFSEEEYRELHEAPLVLLDITE